MPIDYWEFQGFANAIKPVQEDAANAGSEDQPDLGTTLKYTNFDGRSRVFCKNLG